MHFKVWLLQRVMEANPARSVWSPVSYETLGHTYERTIGRKQTMTGELKRLCEARQATYKSIFAMPFPTIGHSKRPTEEECKAYREILRVCWRARPQRPCTIARPETTTSPSTLPTRRRTRSIITA